MIARDRIKGFLIIKNFVHRSSNIFEYNINNKILRIYLYDKCLIIKVFGSDNILVSKHIFFKNNTTLVCKMIEQFIETFTYFEF